jgi:hypothetical protein
MQIIDVKINLLIIYNYKIGKCWLVGLFFAWLIPWLVGSLVLWFFG